MIEKNIFNDHTLFSLTLIRLGKTLRVTLIGNAASISLADFTRQLLALSVSASHSRSRGAARSLLLSTAGLVFRS